MRLKTHKTPIGRQELPKKLFVKTYGCQMNVYDSARMADVLAPLGYESTNNPEAADMVILNTCHIREKAAEKVYSELGRLRPLKEMRQAENRDMLIAVAGCVAQAEGAEMLERAPYVDIVLGPQTYHRLGEMVARATRAAEKKKEGIVSPGILDTDFPAEPKFDSLPTPSASGASAFLSIQEGCDKFCSFCVVPYTRGAEYSRPASAVISEARALVEQGVREITLLGQNVNAYHGEGADGREWGLARLLRTLGEVEGLTRLRYTTSHPRDMEDDLIAAHGDVPQLMPFLHLPVQSGSNKILSDMNRGYTREDYISIIEKLRIARPGIALASDFIVGFPGESDADFEETLSLVREIGFSQAYSFKYSSRPGTPAALSEDQIENEISSERLRALQKLVDEQQLSFNKKSIGSHMDILFDRIGGRPGQIAGRSPYMQSVHVSVEDDFSQWMGKTVKTEIVVAYANSLTGKIVSTDDAQQGDNSEQRACA